MRSDIKGPNCFDHNHPCCFSRYKRDDMGAGYCTPHQTEKVIFCLFFLLIFFVSTFISDGIFSGLHWLWLWSLCWRHCLHWLLNQFNYRTKNLSIFSLTVNMHILVMTKANSSSVTFSNDINNSK